jgi:hypothetical protein
MIGVGHPGAGVDLAGDLVDRPGRRQARPDVQELGDALPGEPAEHAGEEGAVVAGGLAGFGHGAQQPAGGLPAGVVVIPTAAA